MNITEICFLQHKESTKDFRTFLSNLHFIFTSFRLLDVLISQGIDHLDFRPDKFGNQDIVGMVSAEEEVRPYLLYYLYYLHIYNIIYTMQVVAFSNIIYPVDAKGMVEKWLLQVEKQMIKSLRDTIEKAMASYYSTPLTNWVLDWAGQVGNIVL